jgi:hypothetical protein
MVGHAQDVRRAAEVLFQPNDADGAQIAFEVEDVVQIGAAPAVDRLVGIAR